MSDLSNGQIAHTDAFNNPRSVLGLVSSLLGLSTIAVALRFLARRKQKVSLLMDDWFALFAWVLYVGLCAITYWGIHHHHLAYTLPTEKSKQLEAAKAQGYIAYSVDSIVSVLFGSIKISALLFFRRVFCVKRGVELFNIYLLSMCALIGCWSIIYAVLGVLQCGPKVSSIWNPALQKKNCKIGYPYLLSQAISDFLLEIIVLLSPVYNIYKLHTSVQRRLGILLVFLTALVGLGACIARLQTYVMLDNAKLHGQRKDAQLANTRSIYFNALEGGLSLIAVNLPTLFFLRKHANPSKVLASVRSALSLRSNESQGSRNGRSAHGSAKAADDGRSSVSVKSLVPQNTDWKGEVYAMPVLSREEQRALATSPQNGISVLKSVDQRDGDHV